jgi:ADP-ribose pyrophosphatase YjhB (NUDIX family)
MRVRPLVIAIIWRGDQILVSKGYDHNKQQSYYRPLGGEIEFGEYAADALLREFREEIDADLTNLQYINVLENIFEYEGNPHHEIVMIFQADFADHSFFEKEEFDVVEQDTVEKGYWKSWADFDEKTPLYPVGLSALLFPEVRNHQNLSDFDQLWNFNNPQETEQAFRQLLSVATTSGHIDYYLQLLTQIARTQGLQQQFEAAHATLNEVSKDLNKVSKRTLIRYLLERGRVYNSSGEVHQSKPIFTEAWEIAQQSGEDFYAIDAAHMLAIVETPEQQIAWNERALLLAEQSKDPKAQKWLGALYNNLGWTYHDQKDYDKALRFVFARFAMARIYQRPSRSLCCPLECSSHLSVVGASNRSPCLTTTVTRRNKHPNTATRWLRIRRNCRMFAYTRQRRASNTLFCTSLRVVVERYLANKKRNAQINTPKNLRSGIKPHKHLKIIFHEKINCFIGNCLYFYFFACTNTPARYTRNKHTIDE